MASSQPVQGGGGEPVQRLWSVIVADDITQKHLNRSRVRGAPASIPGAEGLVGRYRFEEVWRQTLRALVRPLGRELSVATLRESQTKLAALATKQGLQTLEPAMFALNSDPMEQVPHEWEWELYLPVTGKIVPDEATGVTAGRIHGGAYIATQTTKGLGDLRNLYSYFLGEFFPARHQQLTRPLIYHRVLAGLGQDDPNAVTLEVFMPFAMTLREPVRLVTREEL
jgi:DNA gyrase inhibitor GyrI